MTRFLTTTAVAALAMALPAAAQVYELKPITITADLGEGTPLDETGASVEVITAEDLEKSADNSIASYLARQPGLSLASTGGAGQLGDLRMRGLHQKYVAVQIDGIDVTDLTAPNPSFNFGLLGTAGVGRIEVLKGAQSAQYGAGAVAGVISISSLEATEEGTHVSFAGELGSYHTTNAALTLSSKGERHNVAVTLSRNLSEGFSAADEEDGNTEEDGYSAVRLNFAGEYALSDVLTLGIAGFAAQTDTEIDGGFPFGDADIELQATTNGLRTYAIYEGATVTSTFEASFFNIDRDSVSGGITDAHYEGERTVLRYVGQADLSEALNLNFGADYTEESFTADTFSLATGDQNSTGIFAELNYSPNERLHMIAALRHDEHSTFGSHTTGRLALAYDIQPDLILRGALATGFRAPSLYELNAPFYGNPDLEPEESRSVELGLEKQFGARNFVKATLFYTEVDNLIGYDPFTYQNIQVEGTTTAKGLELSGQVQLADGIDVYGAYTLTESRDENDERTLRVPRHDLVLGVEGQIAPRWTGQLEVQHVADVYDVDAQTYATIKGDDYTLLNATVTYEVTERAEAYLRIENLTDTDYQTVNGYGQPGRSIYAGLRAKF